MSRRLIPMFVVMGFLVLIGTIIGIYPKTVLIIGTALSGWLGVVLQILYAKWDRLYLFVQYLRSFFYPDTSWDITVDYSANEPTYASIDKLQTQMAKKLPEGKLNIILPNLIEFRYEGIIGQVIALSESKYQLHILEVQVSKWKTEEMMNGTLQRIFDAIEAWIKPDFKRYYFTVKFDGGFNPYFGLYIRRLAKSDVINFDITIKVDQNDVALHKDRLTITASNFGELRTMSKKYLLLSVSAS